MALQNDKLLYCFICRHLKTASLTLNIAIMFGCSFVFLSSIPRLLAYGARQYDNSDTQSNAFCQVRLLFSYICLIVYMHTDTHSHTLLLSAMPLTVATHE